MGRTFISKKERKNIEFRMLEDNLKKRTIKKIVKCKRNLGSYDIPEYDKKIFNKLLNQLIDELLKK